METGKFYFVKDEYYKIFSVCNLLENKELDEKGNQRKRPCYYCLKRNDIYWLIPISSKVDKYHKIYEKKIQQRGHCNSISFGYVNGKERAFLLQNMCPITEEYIDEIYTIENGTVEVKLSSPKVASEIKKNAETLIRLIEKGIPCTLSNVNKILGELT